MLGQICFEVKRKQRKRFENTHTWNFKVHFFLSLPIPDNVYLKIYRSSFTLVFQGIELTDTDDASSWSILRDDFMMGAKMKDWNREEQKTKRKDKKLTDITDHELETSNADFFDESDDGNNEEADSESDMDSQGG